MDEMELEGRLCDIEDDIDMLAAAIERIANILREKFPELKKETTPSEKGESPTQKTSEAD